MRIGSSRPRPPTSRGPEPAAPTERSALPLRSARGTEPPPVEDLRAPTEPGLPTDIIPPLAAHDDQPATMPNSECYSGEVVQGDLETPSWLTCQDDVPQSINV